MSERVLSDYIEPGERVAELAAPEHGSQEWAYGFRVVPIENSSHTDGDSVILDVAPGGSVEPVLITGEITLDVRVLRGAGRAVIFNVLHDEAVRAVELTQQSEPLHLRMGDAYYYQNTSEKENLSLRDDCTPAFQASDELQLSSIPVENEPDGRICRLPAAFWNNFTRYGRLGFSG